MPAELTISSADSILIAPTCAHITAALNIPFLLENVAVKPLLEISSVGIEGQYVRRHKVLHFIPV